METITFITSFLTFYLKEEIKHEQNFIKLKIPNTFLTFIPLGAHKETLPVNQIASVDTDFRLHFKSLIEGVIVALVMGIEWAFETLRFPYASQVLSWTMYGASTIPTINTSIIDMLHIIVATIIWTVIYGMLSATLLKKTDI